MCYRVLLLFCVALASQYLYIAFCPFSFVGRLSFASLRVYAFSFFLRQCSLHSGLESLNLTVFFIEKHR